MYLQGPGSSKYGYTIIVHIYHHFMFNSLVVCQEVSPSKFLLALSTAPVSINLTKQSNCLDLHQEGKRLLSYYREICKEGNITIWSTLPGNWTDFESLDDFCAVINTINNKFNITIVDNITAIEDDLIMTPTWCLKDIINILDCLGLDQNYTSILT